MLTLRCAADLFPPLLSDGLPVILGVGVGRKGEHVFMVGGGDSNISIASGFLLFLHVHIHAALATALALAS